MEDMQLIFWLSTHTDTCLEKLNVNQGSKIHDGLGHTLSTINVIIISWFESYSKCQLFSVHIGTSEESVVRNKHFFFK